MPLSSLSKYAAYIAIALNLAACSNFLPPNTTPTLGGLLAAKGDTRPFEVPLPINTEPKRMALGSMFTIGVKADGTVWSWGSGSSGELGRGDYNEQANEPRIIPNMTDFMEIVAGSRHVLALRKDGTVWSWGNNEKGQLGYKEDGHIEPNYYRAFQKTPKQIPDLKNIVSIAAGSSFSLALDKEGRVWGWGGDLEMPNSKTVAPKMILQNIDAAKLIGNALSVAFGILTKTGQVKLWQHGKLTELMFNRPVVDVAVGPAALNTYFLLDTGKVYSVGRRFGGALGQYTLEDRVEPLLISSIGHIVKIDSYSALDDKGRVWQWGREAGVIKDYVYFSSSNIYAQFYPRVMLRSKNIVDIYCCSFALAKDGTVWAWGSNQSGRRGDNNEKKANNNSHSYWTTPVRSLWTWK